MKSLLISGDYFPPQKGGISSFMASVAAVLGPDRVCCLTGVPANQVVPERVSALRIYRRPAVFSGSRFLRSMAFGISITEILLRERPRFIQLASVQEGNLGLWLHSKFHLPFVVYAYGNDILGATRTAWPKPLLAMRQAARVLACSTYTADLVRAAGVHPERVTVLHPGCDTARYVPKSLDPEVRRKFLGERHKDRVILTVGGLVSRKGQDLVIRALPLVRETLPDVTYLIVGDGPYRGELQALATSLGVDGHVIFLGQVSDLDMPDIYALCDIFAMPSRAQLDRCDVEGFGIVYLEANACGKPVIGGRSGGIPDAVIDGETGLLVDPHDPVDTARAIQRLLSDGDFAAKLSHQGRSRVLSEFTLARMRERLLGVLESIGVQER